MRVLLCRSTFLLSPSCLRAFVVTTPRASVLRSRGAAAARFYPRSDDCVGGWYGRRNVGAKRAGRNDQPMMDYSAPPAGFTWFDQNAATFSPTVAPAQRGAAAPGAVASTY